MTRVRLLSLCSLALASACVEPVEIPQEAVENPAGAGVDQNAGKSSTFGGDPNKARWSVKAGEGVELSGTFAYAGEKSGRYRMDFRQEAGSAAPALVHTMELKAPGPWTTRAPVDAGEVFIVAFIDVDNDGPNKGDPGGINASPIIVGSEDVTDVVLEVKDDPDETVFNPRLRHPPPEPPSGGTPPEGTPPDPAQEGAPGGPPPPPLEGSPGAPAPVQPPG